MTSASAVSPAQREPQLRGQTVVVIGGSGGIGLEAARRARGERAHVIITARKAGSSSDRPTPPRSPSPS